MPGKRSDSEAPGWQRLRVTEHGGFAGLMRGAELRAQELDPNLSSRIASLLDQARAAQGHSANYPDGQTLSLQVQTEAGPWSAHFDSADLPDAILTLKGLLTFKPMAPT